MVSRNCNGHTIELLAPAGSLAILKELVDSGADAFYAGGKTLNMRLHRRDLNFDNADLVEASRILHNEGKRLYVTVNKLLGDEDLRQLPDYLDFLAHKVIPDAILVQDMALAGIMKQHGISLPLHASVMMNIHNTEGACAIKEMGFTRAVLSREVSLAEASSIAEKTGIELEYFVHGDMCVAHGSQCYYSAIVFGKSSNRGMCMKPCRWPFLGRIDEKELGTGFPLAVKDMCMYSHIPELVGAGIRSFKIEGRMRDAAYLRTIISAYAHAIDRYCIDPEHFDREKDLHLLLNNRKRDFTQAFAFGNPGSEMLNHRWEGTGQCYSNGKVFSVATTETESTYTRLSALRTYFAAEAKMPPLQREKNILAPCLTVRCDTFSQAGIALACGADALILSGETPAAPETAGWRRSGTEILAALRASWPAARIILELPRMIRDDSMHRFQALVEARKGLFDELLIGALGQETLCARMTGNAAGGNARPFLSGNNSLNVLNSAAMDFWTARGLGTVCASIEAGAADFSALLARAFNLEIIVHGRPTAMYMEHDIMASMYAAQPILSEKGHSPRACQNVPNYCVTLVDEKNQAHPVFVDEDGRSHFLPSLPLCLFDLLPVLIERGVARLRIESALYDDAALSWIVRAYRHEIDRICNGTSTYKTENNSGVNAEFAHEHYGLGALSYD